jgi:nitrite reductase/ring-hydroxylating ferredoxin subunit
VPEQEVIPAFPGSVLDHVGTYRRVLPVSLERMYENALDWEHLPHVHATSFAAIEPLDTGAWGWRARLTSAAGRESTVELRLDRVCRRWITRNLEGDHAGAEIWTHAFPIAERRVDIVVDFFVPGVPRERRDAVGRGYAGLYARLYDEDVAMMVERQEQLDERITAAGRDREPVVLGPRSALRLPQIVHVGGREFVLREVAGELVVYPARCPHQLGPLLDAEPDGSVVTCPWHGYRFDVRSGRCVSGQGCHLSASPRLAEVDGVVTLQPSG